MTFTRSLISLVILFYTFLNCGKSCSDVCPEDAGWNSLITANTREARSIHISWMSDTPSSLYVVQYRLRNTQVYSSSLEISSTNYNITQLSPETDYEVQVCRATSTSSTDDCGNCLFCISTTQAREPPSPPVGVQVRADSSESITVLWNEPESTNGGIRNYSVLCFHNESRENIINETVLILRPLSQFFLEPSSTYSCQVIAYNDYGPSLAQQAVGTTLPVTTVASLLLVVYADGVEFAALTTSAIESRMLTYERLLNTTEDTKIRGLDYHFYRKEVYLTQNNHCITRFPVVLDETTMLSSLRRTADPEILFNRSVDLGSIAVDWVNNELYWVEIQPEYRIMRAIINSDGSVVGPFCVVRFTTSMVTHLAIDPSRGYLYWSGSTTIYRASLNSVRLNSSLESCASDISSKIPLINNTRLETFTIEPNDAIYYIGFDPCFETSPVPQQRTNRSILGTPLNAGTMRIYTGVASSGLVSTDSFDRTLFTAADDIILLVDTSTVATCPNFPSIGFVRVKAPVLSLRTFRSVKQPLPVPPGPPTDILVSTTATEANVTWKAPLFIGELFSDGAFANWIYILEIRSVRDPFVFEDSVNTSALTFLFENLQPETLYEIIVSASGPGGNQTAQDRLVFSTKSADSANFTLLVASKNGVYSAMINGSSASQIGDQLSVESNGVAYDSYTGDYYWSVEGGQGRIYMSKARGSPTPFEGFRRNPFSLKLDWIARRLFWVEDGPTVRGPKTIVSINLEDSPPMPEPFAEVVNIQATVLDSLNGLLFWANENSIHAITLSGLAFESVCCTVSPGASPFGFAMDARRRRLYWLNDREGGNLVVNQLEYNSTACNPNSIVAQDVVGLSFSSSSTVMAYAADNLFIGSLTDSKIYTIASDLGNIGDGQMLALGVIDLGISMTLGYRDLIVVSESLQILPDTLQPIDRRRSSLTPSSASSPPRLSDRATSLETIIEWDPSSLPSSIQNTQVFYTLQYSLLSSNEIINITSSSTSVTLPGIPPETTLTAMVTAYSLWYQSDPTQSKNITSKPALPGTVSNIRAYVYKPTRGSDDLSALVLWDEPRFVVSHYTVSMFLNGQRLYPPPDVPSLFFPVMILYQSPSASTHYIVSARDFENRVNYFLTPGTSYQLQISANNPSGTGFPSQNFTLNVAGPDYPQNFIVINDTGVHLAGVDAELNHPLPAAARPPLAVDTISRFVYWYLESPKSIARQSLNSNSTDIQPYLLLPGDTDLVAMAFEWVGMELYYMLRDQQNNLRIMKVSTVNRDVLAQVGTLLQEQVSPAATIKMVVDPFGGYLHWLVASSAETSLHRMDLRNTSLTSRLTIQQSGSGLTMDLRSLNLSSALLLDPQTGNLLLSNADSGDIVNCSVVSETCITLVNAGTLQPQPDCGGIGLPARSIALNERRLYWIGVTSSCIFAIELSDPTNVLVVSNYGASDILTLSPGQQPLPTQDCLSPNVLNIQDRPKPDILATTNTSATMGFSSPPLDEVCNDVVISFPPVTFGIDVETAEQSLPGLPIFTFEMEYTVDGLLPFNEYQAGLSISNMYSLRRHYLDTFFSVGKRFITREGVPDSPIGVMSQVFGTADILISWDMPNSLTLRGPGQTFYVQIFYEGTLQGEVQVDELSVFVNASVGVVSGRDQNIVVIVSNTALNSTGAPIEVTPWPLVPQPVLVNKTNTTIAVKVVLNDSQLYEPITDVSVKICLNDSAVQCECSQAAIIDRRMFKSVENATEWIFMFQNLQAQALYCVQSVGIYRVTEGFRAEPEVTCGESASIQTDEGVPDPPIIRLKPDMQNILEWNEPLSRGRMILFYTIEAMRSGAPTSNPEKFVTENTQFDLSTTTLTVDVVYSIRVFAMNSIGESNSSNEVEYTRLQGGSVDAQTLAISIGSSVAGFFLIILCLTVVAVLSLSFHRRKKEPTSLSYMYGPDHELSNLRDAYRHAHANNPHYTWSRDDYVCTDEEIELLNKFPRQSLKLETFIDRGEFGEVYQGCAMDILGPETGPTPVAVKTLRKGTTYEEQRKFLSEASLMSKFNHPNIVKVLGVCVDNDPVYIIMELMPAGDLLKFLRDAKRDHGPALLTLSEQVQIALDVAQGCRYLEQQHYIHRDIAARNCLVSSKGADRVVKIGDFGLARDLYSSDYYQVEGQRKLPVRWMAPEALLQGKFTTESDIWSYGVLLWEIMTLGNQPYPGRINQEVLQYVTGGGRLDRPEKCPGRIYHLMQSCWKRYSSERPHFDQIVTIVSSFLERVKRPGSGYYSDSDSDDGDSNLQRQSSGKMPSRTPSIRSGILNLARTGSMKLRNSFRRHGSVHRRDEHAVSQFSEESQSYRERGPF